MSEEALQIAEKRREVKGKGEEESYNHLNAEFQRIARRDKKAFLTCILSRVKQITSPGWMHETNAWTWCTANTQRDWVEREVGGGIGMRNTCISMAD